MDIDRSQYTKIPRKDGVKRSELKTLVSRVKELEQRVFELEVENEIDVEDECEIEEDED